MMYEVILLHGSRIGLNEQSQLVPAFHTEMKVQAAGIAYQNGWAPRLILSGGYCIGVRYDLTLTTPVYGEVSRKPNFSPEAKEKARLYRSEASLLGEILRKDYGVPSWAIIYEEDSLTTQENAHYSLAIIQGIGAKSAAILTLLYHMEKALTAFQNQGREMRFFPLYAEDILVQKDPEFWLPKILDYYQKPRGGQQWNTQLIEQNLTTGRSIAEGQYQPVTLG